MFRLLSNRLVQVVLLLALLSGLIAFRVADPPVIKHWRELTFDGYNRLMPREPGHGVAIVNIDEDSLRHYGQWPWPRTLIGQLPLILKEMGAKAVAFDMVFAEPDRTSPPSLANDLKDIPNAKAAQSLLRSLPDNDKTFADQITQAGNVVTGFVATDDPPGSKVIIKKDVVSQQGFSKSVPSDFFPRHQFFTNSLDVIVNAAAGNGNFTPDIQEDSVLRRIYTLMGQVNQEKGMHGYPALSMEALRVSQGKDTEEVVTTSDSGIESINIGKYNIPTDKDGGMRVYYSRMPRPELYISAWEILSRKVDPSAIKDKIVFIGTSAVGLQDLRSSALGKTISGSQIHAEIVEQALDNKFLTRPAVVDGGELIIAGVISLGVIFLAPFVGTGTLALLGGLLIAGGIGGSLYAYGHYGLLLDPVYPSISIVIIFILSSILTNLRTEMERRAVKTAFGHYISPTLMEELAKNPDKLKLGGEVREISVMFTDIRNFTTISESMDPAELIKMMNDFLTPMTSCVLDNRGTIDKYMGDAMMAFWNAPLDDPEHAVHACTAALQMNEALKAVNAALREQAEKNQKPFKELKAGIGIHTGRASVGNMGSKQRFAYSALGDTVNLASRLEGQTKGYGISVMISEEVKKRAAFFAALEIDLLTVKGRKEPERVYTLLGDAAYAASDAFKELSGVHDRMLAAYRAQKWAEALVLAMQCEVLRPDLSGLYALYRQRIADYQTTPPPAGWQGVWVAKEKS